MLLKDASAFNQKYNLGVSEDSDDKEVFQEGSLLHSMILEPHKVHTDYAFFPGARRAGKAFEDFRAQHPDKRILTEVQYLRCQKYVSAYNRQIYATALIQGGEAEFTATAEILGVKCKARFDYVNVDKGYVLDVKSTGMPAGAEIFKDAVNMYRYDLSAALYLMIAEKMFGKPFTWYFVVVTKTDPQCDVYTLSPETRRTGTAFVYQALTKYKKCKESGLWLDSEQVLSNTVSNDYEPEEI